LSLLLLLRWALIAFTAAQFSFFLVTHRYGVADIRKSTYCNTVRKVQCVRKRLTLSKILYSYSHHIGMYIQIAPCANSIPSPSPSSTYTRNPLSPKAVPIINIALKSVKNISFISINLVDHSSSSERNDNTLGQLYLRASEDGQVGGVGWCGGTKLGYADITELLLDVCKRNRDGLCWTE
jgi:hypothetical protein